jgi:RNA polymerase sigma factor (sigma-70 family)
MATFEPFSAAVSGAQAGLRSGASVASNRRFVPGASLRTDEEFTAFVEAVGSRLRQALVARYGVDVGLDATAAALSWGWEHRGELESSRNRVGYLFRVGQSSTRAHWAWRRRTASPFPAETGPTRTGDLLGEADPATSTTGRADLAVGLCELTDRQRVCVVLVHAHGWSYAEVAELLGVSVAAVTNHVHRGVKRLRRFLEENR